MAPTPTNDQRTTTNGARYQYQSMLQVSRLAPLLMGALWPPAQVFQRKSGRHSFKLDSLPDTHWPVTWPTRYGEREAAKVAAVIVASVPVLALTIR